MARAEKITSRKLTAGLLPLWLAALLALAAPASAAVTHPLQSSFDGSETPAGSFAGSSLESLPVAVDAASGDVYVADLPEHGAIDKFDSEGHYLCQITGRGNANPSPPGSECDPADPGTPEGALTFSPGEGAVASLAVDNSTGPDAGDLYLGLPGTDEVQSLTPPSSGTYTLAFEGQTTTPLGAAASAAEVQAALRSLSTIGSPGNANVAAAASGAEIRITFEGSLARTDVEQLAVSGGTPPASVTTRVQGAPPAIDRFGSSGKYLSQIADPLSGSEIIGIGVDAAGRVWTGWEVRNPAEQTVYEFGPGGEGAPLLHFPSPVGIPLPIFTVDSNDNTYMAGLLSLEVHDSAGNFVARLRECNGDTVCLAAVGVDLSTDRVYVGERFQETEAHTVLSEPGVVEYDPSGQQLGTFARTELPSHGGPAGIAVDPATGAIYVSDAKSGKVFVYSTPGPRVTAPEVGGATAKALSLKGTVDPEGGELTSCAFEYGTDTSYGEAVPCEQSPAQVGSGSEFVEVTAELKGLEPGTVYHFRLAAVNHHGSSESADRHAETLPAPAIDEAKAIEVQPTSATLTAKVNPEGNASTCQIEWGATPEPGNPALPYEHTEACQPSNLGNGIADVPVTLQLGGLSQGTSYHWRLIAANNCNPAEPAEECTVESPEHTFVYLPPQSELVSQSCPNQSLRSENASLALPDCRAYEQVSPTQKNGSLLGDTFIFGVPPAVSRDGQRVMTNTVQCFAGPESCPAFVGHIGSLYAFSRTPAGWQAASLGLSAPQFEENAFRAYGVEAGAAVFLAPPSADSQVFDFYVRRLGMPPTDVGPLTPAVGERNGRPLTQLAYTLHETADLSHLVWESVAGPLWPFDSTVTVGTTTRTLYEYTGAGNTEPLLVAVRGGKGSDELISECGATLRSGDGPDPFFGSVSRLSEDGSVVYFEAKGHDDLEGCPQGATAPPVRELFARVDGEIAGKAETVAVSEPEPAECGPGNAPAEEACRQNTSETANFRDAAFRGASADGQRVFFISTQQLTDAAGQDPAASDDPERCFATSGANGCNLYEYDRSRAAGHRLLDLSAGDSSGGGPRVQGVLAISTDGTHAYFVAKGVLSGEPNQYGRSAVSGAENLYAFRTDAAHPEGQLSFIAALRPTDLTEWSARLHPREANVTPDGRFLLFTSRGRLTPDDTSRSAAAQVFRYDASSEELTRISIGERGFDDNGNRSTSTPCAGSADQLACSEDATIVQPNYNEIIDRDFNPSLSDDGSSVFFTSPIALTPGASETATIRTTSSGIPAYAQNVYEWHDGHVYLISDGRDAGRDAGQSEHPCGNSLSTVCLLGTDAEGKNVFFSTADSLVPGDTNTELDYYDARVDGGFPEAAQPEVCETADACHQAGTAEGSASQPSRFEGPEEGAKHPYSSKCRKGFVKKRGGCVKARRHRHKHAKKKSHGRAGASRGDRK